MNPVSPTRVLQDAAALLALLLLAVAGVLCVACFDPQATPAAQWLRASLALLAFLASAALAAFTFTNLEN